ncbi:hypothetical protein GF327_03300 [Candidatus Woesearchaeota archaeon]|nr:hypothetical protein [Candidatus Woesearchaeota archaeon]
MFDKKQKKKTPPEFHKNSTFPKLQTNLDPASKKLAGNINEIMRRLRILEERYSNLRKKNQLTDQNMLDDSKTISDEIRVLQSIVTDLKKEIQDVNIKISTLNQEISQAALKRDFNRLSRYIDYWQPMDFVNKNEVKKIIEDTLDEIRTNQKLFKQKSQ